MELIADLVKLFAGALFTYLLFVLKKRYEKKEDPQESNSLSIKLMISTLSKLNDEINYTFERTSCERFLILFGENGEKSLKYVTAIFEFHKETQELSLSVGATNKYVKIEIDSAYNEMIKKAEIEGVFKFDYIEANQSALLTKYYKSEKIKHSNLNILKRLRNSLCKGRDLVYFVSWAKHSDGAFTDIDEAIIELCNSKLKHLLGFNND